MQVPKSRNPDAPMLSRESGFFLDLDGTLLDIADHPGTVHIDGRLLRLLKALRSAAGGAMALISGRPVGDIDRLLADSGFCVAGQHGAERRDFSGTMHRHDVPRAALEEIGRAARRERAERPWHAGPARK